MKIRWFFLFFKIGSLSCCTDCLQCILFHLAGPGAHLLSVHVPCGGTTAQSPLDKTAVSLSNVLALSPKRPSHRPPLSPERRYHCPFHFRPKRRSHCPFCFHFRRNDGLTALHFSCNDGITAHFTFSKYDGLTALFAITFSETTVSLSYSFSASTASAMTYLFDKQQIPLAIVIADYTN